ncbi:energy-coupling factor transporter ATPase [Acetobacterium sp. KB-1]|jgi:energy-coupling factor transport system ATP-binding protein|uniref:energy-coupling factor transporter ATPase n=1 Tax=Acetobacterium sp. KB-1 TaxID=2184575 RepID=UPI000DBECA2F|nr:energy-coupling factor transporter ATPase [Acetobacterium sp. KB-1]AWW26703.1 energy-coupling factor transporter ATPase [Acetobacterium sp. KB-1]
MSVEIKNLSHTYSEGSPFEFKALKEINITIEDGSFIGIIGHTGSGKSTLIQHLNGLLTPTSGTVLVDGKDIFDTKKSELIELRHRIGLVFQYPEHQLFEETVQKDVAFGPKNQGLSQEEIDTRVRQSIKMVGLDFETIKDKSPFELSGGQMRRVAIAGVLAMEPAVLILDEPTAGLDPQGREEILAQIKLLHTQKQITVILVSHSMEDIGKMVDKILVINEGEVVFFDTPSHVFTQISTLESIGLAVPEVTYLMRRLKEKYPEIREDIFTVEAAKKEILKVIRG